MYKSVTYIPGRFSLKLNEVLVQSLKNGCNFLHEPCFMWGWPRFGCTNRITMNTEVICACQ